jgi:anti-sigma regulatory factor (Ser/Thr protein kinase)
MERTLWRGGVSRTAEVAVDGSGLTAALPVERGALAAHEPADEGGPPKLDSVTLDAVLARRPLETGMFDLTGTTFVSPSGIVGLAIAVDVAARAYDEVSVVVNDPSVRTYLARSRFLAEMGTICKIDPPVDRADVHRYDHRIGRSPMLIELSRIDDHRDLEAILDRAIEALVGSLGYTRAEAFRAATLLSEVGANVIEHGGGRGLGAMQVYGPASGSFVEIAIGDAGPGIRRALAANPNLPRTASDVHAILEAVKHGVSSFSDPTRGVGLHHVLRITTEHRGWAQIRSGSGKVRWRGDKRRGWGFDVAELAGAQVTLGLPAKPN